MTVAQSRHGVEKSVNGELEMLPWVDPRSVVVVAASILPFARRRIDGNA